MAVEYSKIKNTLEYVAKSLGVKPKDLFNLINFESKWNPLARNTISGARGLIQFMHTTAQSMGFKNADDLVSKYPDINSQLSGPVLTYLSKYKPFNYPYPQSLYMSVFYPAYRNRDPYSLFPDPVRKQNPGINRIIDYVNFVEKKKYVSFFLIASILVGGALFYHYKKETVNLWLKKTTF